MHFEKFPIYLIWVVIRKFWRQFTNPMAFNKRKGEDKNRALEKFSEAFEECHHDIGGALHYFLHETQLGSQNRFEITQSFRKAFHEKPTKQEKQLLTLLQAISNLFNTYPENEKYKALELVIPLFSRNELSQIGIDITEEEWEETQRVVFLNRGQGQETQEGYVPQEGYAFEGYENVNQAEPQPKEEKP